MKQSYKSPTLRAKVGSTKVIKEAYTNEGDDDDDYYMEDKGHNSEGSDDNRSMSSSDEEAPKKSTRKISTDKADTIEDDKRRADEAETESFLNSSNIVFVFL